MIGKQWKVKPPMEAPKAGIWLGAGGDANDGVWLGSLAESVATRLPQIWLATSKEQVVAIVGKRGSGKSFTLGVIAEGLSTNGGISKQATPRAALLFDPLDVYWTTRFPVAPSSNTEVQRHYELARSVGLTPTNHDVLAWIPGAKNRKTTDPNWFRTLELPVPDLEIEEWESLLGVDSFSEPIGQAFSDALGLVRDHGHHRGSQFFPKQETFGLDMVADATQSDELATTYHAETLRALRQRLSFMNSTGLFSHLGTQVGELLRPGSVTVVMLERLPQGFREAVVSVLTRMLIRQRAETAFAEKRLALDPELDDATRDVLKKAIESGVPKTIVILDEAQTFLAPGPRAPARDLFIRLVKEGRNIGLSAVLATQQPSALDQRVLSQVETFVTHQLVTESDIRAVRDNLKSSPPEAIQYGSLELNFSDLLRQLPAGVCLVSAADTNTTVKRCMIVHVRPRATVHGGIEL